MAITADHAGHLAGSRRRGFFGRILEAMMEARMKQARAYAKTYLLELDDESLRLLGHTREEIRRWEHAPGVYLL